MECHRVGRGVTTEGIEHVHSMPSEHWGNSPCQEQRPSPAPLLHSGWVSAIVTVSTNTAVAVLMLLVALLFTGVAVLGIVMLKRVRDPVEVGGWRL